MGNVVQIDLALMQVILWREQKFMYLYNMWKKRLNGLVIETSQKDWMIYFKFVISVHL